MYEDLVPCILGACWPVADFGLSHCPTLSHCQYKSSSRPLAKLGLLYNPVACISISASAVVDYSHSQVQPFDSWNCRPAIRDHSSRMSKQLVLLALASMMLLALAVEAAELMPSSDYAEVQKRHKSKYGAPKDKDSDVSSSLQGIVCWLPVQPARSCDYPAVEAEQINININICRPAKPISSP